ncbi:ABC transporter permease [Photobacterium leiognathi]|uniref:ABC transporter permease n=1 Tax=Photobacterium leiognathi TaxID=553611 RepID=UPI0027388404|nr:ABC transporter permease [Photobacterium leiognathi]
MLKDYLYIAVLAFRDISHERILSFCMACSLGAIFTPIIILLGLQQGIIGNMLDTLESDPASRLVRPKFMSQSPIPLDTLEVIRQSGIAFIPSETSHLLLDVKGMHDSINAVPSSKNDPFFIQSNPIGVKDNNKWVVISEPLAQKLGKIKGDNITLLLRRTTNTNYPEEVPMDFRIVGVLNSELMPDVKMYIPVDVFNGIYHWRKGYEISALGLMGSRESNFQPEYDGVITGFSFKKPKSEDFRQMLAGRLPFSSMPEVYTKLTNSGESTDWRLWQTVNNTITMSDVQVLNNALLNYGYDPQIIPYIENIELDLHKSKVTKSWYISMLPENLSPRWSEGTKPILYVSSEDKHFSGEQQLLLKTGIKGNKVKIPVLLEVSDQVSPGFIVASHHFSGLLRTAERLGASYDTEQYKFSLSSQEQIRYFRVYSESIDELDALVKIVKGVGDDLGIHALKKPVSRLYEVQKIRTLSDYMKKIYFLIATISGISTVFAVSASVYATVQRRRKDLAYLNMLGVDKRTIIFFPFIKSMILISIGLVISFIAYWIFGVLASHWFVDLLGETASLTRLKIDYALSLIIVILSLGGITSLLAGSLVTRMDSQRYIHE